MIKEHNVVPLFGIPLCQTQIQPYEESENFLKEKIEYVERSHKVSYISKDDYVLDNENLMPLKNEIETQVSEFMHGYLDIHEKHRFVITTSWCNRYEHNHFIQEHYHSNSLISGVLFLSDCQDTANIVFHKIKIIQIFLLIQLNWITKMNSIMLTKEVIYITNLKWQSVQRNGI